MSSTNSEPTILVLFGITGDLAQRKLLPALRRLAEAGLLPNTRIIGISRRAVSAEEILRQAFGEEYDAAAAVLAPLLSIHTMDIAQAADYQGLAAGLAEQRAMAPATQVLFYLSVPPQAAVPIAEHLGQAGLNDEHVKLLLEKPFGVDLPSAQESIAQLQNYFQEPQLYRIDHYLAKEMAQNIIAFRSHNALFRNLWHADFIDHIDIVAMEQIGIEGRAAFYEQTGALRDFMQNHLLQLLALTIMDIPAELHESDIPGLRLQALESLRPIQSDAFGTDVVRGQYRGYAEEVANPGSTTETFVGLTLTSTDPRWQGVPFHLATGKRLAEQTTEIRVFFRKAHAAEANQLILQVQPKEGIEIALWAKKPGYEKRYEPMTLGFDYRAGAGQPVEAYERVLLDALSANKSLFTSASEVLASWRLLQPVQEHWELHTEDLTLYEPGAALETILPWARVLQ